MPPRNVDECHRESTFFYIHWGFFASFFVFLTFAHVVQIIFFILFYVFEMPLITSFCGISPSNHWQKIVIEYSLFAAGCGD